MNLVDSHYFSTIFINSSADELKSLVRDKLTINRPSLDLLIHVIEITVMAKFLHDYDSLVLGRNKPFWWKAFVSEWKKCAQSDVQGNSFTDTDNFICSCRTWMRSQYFLCKNLVHDESYPYPKYHKVRLTKVHPS